MLVVGLDSKVRTSAEGFRLKGNANVAQITQNYAD